jgi:hypothetical protein
LGLLRHGGSNNKSAIALGIGSIRIGSGMAGLTVLQGQALHANSVKQLKCFT